MLPSNPCPYPPQGTTVYPTRPLTAVYDPLPWTPSYLTDIRPRLRAEQERLKQSGDVVRIRVPYSRGFAVHRGLHQRGVQ